MRRALAAPCFLRFSQLASIFMLCAAEGIVLLDVSQPCSWQIRWVNDAFRAAVGMPDLLQRQPGLQLACSDCDGLQEPPSPLLGHPEAVANFWQLFEMMPSGSQGSLNVSGCRCRCCSLLQRLPCLPLCLL